MHNSQLSNSQFFCNVSSTRQRALYSFWSKTFTLNIVSLRRSWVQTVQTDHDGDLSKSIPLRYMTNDGKKLKQELFKGWILSERVKIHLCNNFCLRSLICLTSSFHRWLGLISCIMAMEKFVSIRLVNSISHGNINNFLIIIVMNAKREPAPSKTWIWYIWNMLKNLSWLGKY